MSSVGQTFEIVADDGSKIVLSGIELAELQAVFSQSSTSENGEAARWGMVCGGGCVAEGAVCGAKCELR